ncbi:MAG: DUF1499 domain-containing protein [Alphaproteobacteria bacterium]|nr:DUF1499 domain-containing protein [Alphaproteobacteria bacterium]
MNDQPETAAVGGNGPGKLVFALALACVGLLIAVALAYRFGAVGVREAFTAITWIVWAAAAVSLLALVVLIMAYRAGRTAGVVLAAFALVIGCLSAWVPYGNRLALRASPRLSDITTDTARPPAFVAIEALRKATNARNSTAYGPAKARLQASHYPDIKPVVLALPPDRAYLRALQLVKDFGWRVVAADAAAGRIEAYDTSLFFGFVDDVVIRITAAGRGSRIDIRSSSRVGRRDAAVNANRVRKLIDGLTGS